MTLTLGGSARRERIPGALLVRPFEPVASHYVSPAVVTEAQECVTSYRSPIELGVISQPVPVRVTAPSSSLVNNRESGLPGDGGVGPPARTCRRWEPDNRETVRQPAEAQLRIVVPRSMPTV